MSIIRFLLCLGSLTFVLTVLPVHLQVKRIDYYQRTDQALSQLLSGAAVDINNPEVTTYLHGDGLLTLRMAQLPDGQGLPGADTNQIWFWLRPRQVCEIILCP